MDLENQEHLAPIHIAARRRHDEVVALLAAAGAHWVMPEMVWTVAAGNEYEALPPNAHASLRPALRRTVAELEEALARSGPARTSVFRGRRVPHS